MAIFGVTLYTASWGNWWWFAALILLPDISMFGYLVNKSLGAFCYNIAHSLVFPLLLITLAFVSGTYEAALVGYVWITHIGVDRALGFGLKYQDDFKHTHLGWLNGGKKP